MATKTKQQNGYAPRLKTRYEQELRSALKDQLEFSSVMQVPRIEKITVNMGVGEAKTNAKTLDNAVEELTTITGQRAQITRAKKSIAGFKIREGMPIGAKATLRGVRMYEFLDRLVSIALSSALASVFASPTPMLSVIFWTRGTCMTELSWSSSFSRARTSCS